MQLVVAGKAHPADDGGKKLIQELVRFTDDPAVRNRIVFLPNYDIAMAQALYPGCDVWLNNPLRPLEACGTSGMKSALNGGLNLSVLDGWWDEMYDGHNGWAIPTADGVTDPDHRDDLEASALYDLMENTVAPLFYDRSATGQPARWIEMVRHTLQTLGPQVLASRMVRDYVQGLYSPACRSAHALNESSANQPYGGARELAAWKIRVRAAWSGVRVDHVEASGVGDVPEVGSTLELRAFVSLGDLTPDDVDVQVVHGRVDDRRPDHRHLGRRPAACRGLRGRAAPLRGRDQARAAGPVRLHDAHRAQAPAARRFRRAGARGPADCGSGHGVRRPALRRHPRTTPEAGRLSAVKGATPS